MILMLILILFLVFFFLDSRIANFPVAIKLMPWKKRYGSICVGRFTLKVHLVVTSPRRLYTVVQKLLRVHSMGLNNYCDAIVVVMFQELVSNH